MIRAYDKSYLGAAQTSLGRSLDYAVYDAGYELADYYRLFLASAYAARFEHGDYRVLAGMSGVELACRVFGESGIKPPYPEAGERTARSPEYWTGWALAYYQWQTAYTFAEIEGVVPIETVCGMYMPYHEMDISAFVRNMNERMKDARSQTRLKALRRALGMTQRELASRSGVPLRSIQQYEQRQKNINKASFETVLALAAALHCRDASELLERGV